MPLPTPTLVCVASSVAIRQTFSPNKQATTPARRSYEVFALLVALYALVLGPYRQWRATVLYFYAAITPTLIGLTNECASLAATRLPAAGRCSGHAAGMQASMLWHMLTLRSILLPPSVPAPCPPPTHPPIPHPPTHCSVLVAKGQLPGSNGSDARANAVAAGLVLVLIGNGVQVGRAAWERHADYWAACKLPQQQTALVCEAIHPADKVGSPGEQSVLAAARLHACCGPCRRCCLLCTTWSPAAQPPHTTGPPPALMARVMCEHGHGHSCAAQQRAAAVQHASMKESTITGAGQQ